MSRLWNAILKVTIRVLLPKGRLNFKQSAVSYKSLKESVKQVGQSKQSEQVMIEQVHRKEGSKHIYYTIIYIMHVYYTI